MLTKSQIDNLVKEHGAPLLVIKRQQLVDSYTTLKELLPRVGIFYAVKSNPHPEIVKTFADLGSSFEVASGTEIDEILSLGIDPDRIIFANPVKKIADLQNARESGVDITTFDNELELDKIAEHLPRSKVVLRLKVPNIDSIVDLSLKFGAEPAAAVPLMQKAREKGLIPTGVSFHVGSQCLNTVNYGKAIELSSGVFSACKEAGINLSLLDIGGGFPIKYLPQVNVPSINDIARKINHSLDKYFPDKRIKIIAEPGRYLSGEAVTLLSSVIGRATRNGKRWYTMDDGIYGTFSGIMFDHAKYQFHSHKEDEGELCASVLAGPSCDSLDVIADDLYLPELGLGDIIITPSIGAYSSAHATKFNGIPLTKSVVV
ncbi:type III PLP-dependent enzyme [Candidatus Margulisiibacteriota bacterium]